MNDTIIIILMTGVLLALIEIVLRVSVPEMGAYRKSPKSTAFQFNDKYLVSLKPNHSIVHRVKKENGGGSVNWQTNSLGFRGEELDPKKKPRIIVYGDSNVLARFSEDKDTYTNALQSILQSNNLNAQVINAGIAGAGPDQNLIRLREDFPQVKPDIVIFHLFADNDYGDIMRNRLYDIADNGELIKTVHPVTIDKKLTSKGALIGHLTRNLYLQGAINYLVTSIQEQKQNALSVQQKVDQTLNKLEQLTQSEYHIYKNELPRQSSHFGDHYDIDIATDPRSESAQIKIKLMEKVVLTAKQFCDEKKIPFLVVVQPSMIDLTNLNPNYGRYQDLAQKYPLYKQSNLTDPLKNICIRHNVHCVHLIDSYRQNDPDSLYLGDGHWNAKGQWLAAEQTQKKLKQILAP
ncbi:MAG: hypothetical protein P1P93_00330 [Gammaproteobacteria bacterium]|nr:hypothetical protein [Gammaproteobacteria bacterium]